MHTGMVHPHFIQQQSGASVTATIEQTVTLPVMTDHITNGHQIVLPDGLSATNHNGTSPSLQSAHTLEVQQTASNHLQDVSTSIQGTPTPLQQMEASPTPSIALAGPPSNQPSTLPSTPPTASSPPDAKIIIGNMPGGSTNSMVVVSHNVSLSQAATPEQIETVTMCNMDGTPVPSPSCHTTASSEDTYKLANSVVSQQFKAEGL